MPGVVCPYCFSRMRSRALQFRCLQSPRGTRSGKPCPAEPDDKLTASLGRSTPILMGPVFSADGSRSQASCPVCGVVTTKRVCPECHNDLPSGYDSIGGRIIALVGPKTSGKSTYITVLIRELRERVGEYFGAAVNPMDDRTTDRYESAYAELFKEGHLPPMTPPSALDLTYPQLYKATIPRRGVLGTRSLSSALVFFDTAGEDLESADSTARNVSYLAQADGIIMMVDPLQFAAVRDALSGAVDNMPRPGSRPDQVVAVIGQLIRDHRGMRGNQPISTPLAITLSKIDVLQPILGSGSRLMTPSAHRGFLDERDRIEVDDEVRAFLQDWDGGALRRQVQADFAGHAFFGMSALGGAPAGPADTPAAGVHPLRAEDPVLWLLSRFGLITVRKERR
jgi:GTPase SAR1 family protein